MPKHRRGVFVPGLERLEPGSGHGALHHQLYTRLREAILSGALPHGTRLPSSRTLAKDLAVSRTTVELAFSQLDAERLVSRRVGSGSIVTRPEHARPPKALNGVRAKAPTRTPPRLAAWGARVATLEVPREPLVSRPLTPCMPALDAFPGAHWTRAMVRAQGGSAGAALGYAPAEGAPELQRALQQHLSMSRGVRCDPRQLLIFQSTQQAIDTCARVLLDPGDEVWMEEPGYVLARTAFQAAGASVIPVAVGPQGMEIAEAQQRAPKARLAYVTPSHQYPLGVTLDPTRRRALLAWAAAANAFILEDDYDSEFRYTTRPLASIQSIDTAGRVLYAGTFNKVLFPSVRVAFLVVPEPLVDVFTAARAVTAGHVAQATQLALADFIDSGMFGAHLRAMRLLYEERRDTLLDALRRALGTRVTIGPTDAGMHVTVSLAAGVDDVALVERARDHGLDPRALSPQFLERARPGLILGYSGAPPADLRRAIDVLARLVPPR